MRKLLLFALAFIPFFVQAQGIITFENFSLTGSDTFYVNKMHHLQDDGFDEGIVHFPYVYDTTYGGFWSGGFAYSNKTDSVTSGSGNLYSAKAGKGYGGSAKYAVFTPGYNTAHNIQVRNISHDTIENHNWFTMSSMYVTNSTYAYNSMRDGDGLAKKFGGVTGHDPDWFKLVIRGYRHWGNQIRMTDTVEFYLADFRSADSTKNYIIKDWTRVNLTKIISADSLSFDLSSSDTNMYGMLTPAFFCLDNISLAVPIGIKNVPAQNFAKVYPNPATNNLYVEITDADVKQVSVYDVTGKLMATQPAAIGKMSFNTATFANGVYMLRLDGQQGSAMLRFIKQ